MEFRAPTVVCITLTNGELLFAQDAAQSSALRETTAPKGAVYHAKSSFPWIDGPKRGQSPRNSVLCYAGLPLPEMPDGILAEVKVEKPRESQRPAHRARDFSSLHDHTVIHSGGTSVPRTIAAVFHFPLAPPLAGLFPSLHELPDTRTT